MQRSKRRIVLVFVLLIPVYMGPYAYVYGMTSIDVFPRVEKLDREAMDKLVLHVDNSITALPQSQGKQGRVYDGQTASWNETSYSFRIGFLNRIFPTYITFPALLDISKITFEATGVLNGTAIFTCNQFIERLPVPTGFEALAIYGSILKAQNNSFVAVFCKGPGQPIVDFVSLSQKYGAPLPIVLDWRMSATLKGERLEVKRIQSDPSWSGTMSASVILPSL